MNKQIWNKLVRDGIPNKIMAHGDTYHQRKLSEVEYKRELELKLLEELKEFQAKQSINELADMLEVVQAIAEAHGYALDELDAVRSAKAAKFGGFKDRIYLIDTESNSEYRGD